MEVCVDCVASAVNAERGGAKRVELCSNLMEGGTTPSLGMLQVMKASVNIPVFTMIRPRGGDFLYSDMEFEVMKKDVVALKGAGADGIVIGILNRDGSVDTERCGELLGLAKPLPVTFHRAIDMTRDLAQSLEEVISLGCERVLTSGGEVSALEGVPVIKKMIQQADQRIIVMPGGGITERNLGRVIAGTGAKEFHGSARSTQDSLMEYRKTNISMGAALSPPEFSTKVTNSEKVSLFMDLYTNLEI